MKIKNILTGLSVGFCIVLLTGCASKTVTPGNYDSAEVGKINQVAPGVIISKRPVNINAPATNPAAAPTANVPTGPGVEYIVKLNSGSIVSVVQAEDLRLKVKQHILVVYGATTRIVPDESNS